MTDRQSELVDAAITLFTHYSVKKTSMAAVAEEAGVSRQTLYSIFPSKDELVAASMRKMIDQIKNNLVAAWEDCDSVDQILDVYFKHSVFKVYQVLSAAPDLKDLLHGIGPDTKKLAEKAESEKAELLSEQFSAYETQLNHKGTSAAELSKFIVRSTTEFKFTAKSKKELTGLLATLRTAVLALCAG